MNLFGDLSFYCTFIFLSGSTIPKEDREILITIYAQVSPFAATRTSITILGLIPNESPITSTCVSGVNSEPTGFSMVKAQMQTPTVDTADATGKLVSTFFTLSLPPESKQSYSILTEVVSGPGVELGYATVHETDSILTNIVPKMPLLTSFQRSGDNNLLLKAEIFMGTVHNTDNAASKQLMIMMKMKLREDADVPSGSTITLRAVLKWVGGTQDPQEFTITQGTATSPPASLTPEKQPSVSVVKLQPATANFIAQYGTVIQMDIQFASDFVYTPVKLQLKFSQPVEVLDSGFERIDECLASIIPVGLNFEDKGENTYELQLDSVFGVCRTAAEEGKVVVRFVVSQSTNQAYTVSAKVLVNNIPFETQTDIVVDAFTEPAQLDQAKSPMVASANLEKMNDDPFVYPGVNLLFTTFTITPSAKQNYEMHISTTDNTNQGPKVCYPRLLNFDPQIGFRDRKPLLETSVLKKNLGYIYYEDNPVEGTLGRHTITYAVPVKLTGSGDASGTIKLVYGSKESTKSFGTKAIAASASTNEKITTNYGRLQLFDFNPYSTYTEQQNVSPGEVVKFFYTFHIHATKCSNYEVIVQLTGDTGWPVDLTSIHLHSHGESVWCLDTIPTFTVTKVSDKPILSTSVNLNMDTVCTHGTTASWVRVLIYARPWATHPVEDSQVGPFVRQLQVKLAENGIINTAATQTLQFTIDPNKSMSHQPSKSPTATSIEFSSASASVEPGKEVTVTAKIRIPPAAKLPNSMLTFECEAEGTPSQAPCTVSEITIRSGADYASIDNEMFGTQLNTTVDSGQLNRATLNLGNLVQTGASHALGLGDTDADVLTVITAVKLADSARAENAAKIPVKFTASLAGIQTTKSIELSVTRTGDETINLELIAELLTKVSSSSFGAGDELQVRVNRTVKENSQLECKEQKLHVHQGKVFTDVTISNQSEGMPQFQINPAFTDDRITEFKAGGLFFDQSAWVIFNLRVRSDLALPADLFYVNSALVFELICLVNPRTDPKPVETVRRFVAMETVPVALPGGCMKSLGMDDETKIRDCQITSFSSGDPNHRAPNIRYSSNVGWKPPVRSGEYSRYRYVDILFGKWTAIKKIRIKLIIIVNKVLKIDIYATNDGRAYYFYEQAEINYRDAEHGSVYLSSQLKSRGVRLVVSQQEKEDEEVNFTIDLQGCDEEVDSNSFDPCALTPHSLAPKDGFLPPPFIIEPRVFLYANGQFFFCDLIMDPFVTFSRRKRCYRSADSSPSQWFDMGPLTSQILTYLPNENIVFGIGSDGQSLVQSTDLGRHWVVINRLAYQVQVVGATTSVNATAVPWAIIPGKFDGLTKGTLCTAYTGGSWYICYDGIYRDAQLYVDWNTKCPKFTAPRV